MFAFLKLIKPTLRRHDGEGLFPVTGASQLKTPAMTIALRTGLPLEPPRRGALFDEVTLRESGGQHRHFGCRIGKLPNREYVR